MPKCRIDWCQKSFVCFSLLRDHEWAEHEIGDPIEDDDE